MRISPFRLAIGLTFIVAGIFMMRQQPEAPDIKPAAPQNIQPGPIRHASLSPEMDARIRRFEPVFAEVYPRSHDQWLDGFKHDANPEREVAIWEAMAVAYQTFTQKHTLTPDARKEAFGLLVARSAADEQTTLSGAKLSHLSHAEAEELVRLYSAAPKPVEVLKK